MGKLRRREMWQLLNVTRLEEGGRAGFQTRAVWIELEASTSAVLPESWEHEVSALLLDGRKRPQHPIWFSYPPQGMVTIISAVSQWGPRPRDVKQIAFESHTASKWLSLGSKWHQLNPKPLTSLPGSGPPAISSLASSAWNSAQLDHGCHFTHTCVVIWLSPHLEGKLCKGRVCIEFCSLFVPPQSRCPINIGVLNEWVMDSGRGTELDAGGTDPLRLFLRLRALGSVCPDFRSHKMISASEPTSKCGLELLFGPELGPRSLESC